MGNKEFDEIQQQEESLQRYNKARLLIIRVRPGKDVDLETEGYFHDYEIVAALDRAEEKVLERMHAQESDD